MENLHLQTLMLSCGYPYIFGIAFAAAPGRVHMNGGMWEAMPPSFGSTGEQGRTHTAGKTYTGGMHRGCDHLHGIVDGKSRINTSTRTVHIHINGLFGVCAVQVKQLGYYHIGKVVINGSTKENNPFLPQ
jgi:hypothetical protein